MIDTLLKFIAPHYCYGCAEIGSMLCTNCKYNITSEPYEACVACGTSLTANGKLCSGCTVAYSRAWCVGGRHGPLEDVLDAYKFRNAKAAHKPLSDLLDSSLPDLPGQIVVVPIPTITAHIRQRGYDHMYLIAKRFAKIRKYQLSTCLKRVSNTAQRGSGKRQRIKQAKQAYACSKTLDSNAVYLLLDDVVTTGSTLKYAAETLRSAGAETIWIATISRQTFNQKQKL